MDKTKNTTEPIIQNLRTLEIETGKGMTTEDASRMRDDFLSGEIFCTLTEAKVLIDRW